MRQLMISLDKQIAHEGSRVAKRMEFYGKRDEIFILIPDSQNKTEFKLGDRVHVEIVGGTNKFIQGWRLFQRGTELVKKYGLNFITTQDPFFTGLIGLALRFFSNHRGQKVRVRLEVQLHGDFFSSDYYKNKQFLKYCLSWFIIKRADKVRVASHRNKESLIKKLKINNKSKVRINPVSVNYDRFRNYKLQENILRKRYARMHGKIFLWLGRMEPVKNLFFLLDVFKSVVDEKPDWLLVLVGEGSEKNKLIVRVRDLKLENNVYFETWTQDPIPYYKSADCVLLPSLSEGYSLVAMEAVAAGVPIVMHDVGVANYELKSGSMVTIVPIGDKDKFVQAVLSI